VKRFAQFGLITSAIALLGAALLARVFRDAGAPRAVWTSAAAAIAVQLTTFAIARRYAKTGNVMLGWGIGGLIRVAALAVYGFAGTRALGLPLAPTLLSFALFLFISTVLEPLFLSGA
jgi:hypothetical protein